MPKHAKTKDSTKSLSSSSSKRIRYVPFARGFRHRDHAARCLALGFDKSEKIPREFSCDTTVGSKVVSSLSSSSSSSSSSSKKHSSASTMSSSSSTSSDELFKPIPQPTSRDDWLAQYDEDGQTYKQFLEENPWLSSRKIKYTKQQFLGKGKTISDKYPDGKICILQLGKFDNKYIKFADIIDYSRKFLCLPVEELAPLDLEVEGGKVVVVDDPVSRGSEGRSTRVKRTELVTRYNAKSGHIQLRVDSVLSKLRTHIPTQALCLIALTTMDLYGDTTDLFVAGMAAGNQRVAVFSLLRYDPTITFSKENWYDIKSIPKSIAYSEGSYLMVHRSCKLVVHEILHLLGVDHCVFFDCCMNGSGHLDEDFRQPMHLCPVDLRKLHTLVGFDIRARYRSLKVFYAKHSLAEEEDWVQKRLDFLGDS